MVLYETVLNGHDGMPPELLGGFGLWILGESHGLMALSASTGTVSMMALSDRARRRTHQARHR